MTLKEQGETIKKNWLIALIVAVLVGIFLFSGDVGNYGTLYKSSDGYMAESVPMIEMTSSYRGGGYYSSESFAPGASDRKITKSASLSSEIDRGKFTEAETKLKGYIDATNSFLLAENVQKYGTGKSSYLTGNYQIKVETSKYDHLVSQLKELGEVQSFSETAQDITGRYTDLKTELDAEKARLERFQKMLDEANNVNEKIELTDRIYDLEKTISYLEDALENIDQRVEYSTVYVTLTEEQSGYANLALVKFSELVRKLVSSFNSLVNLIFWILPWAVAGLLVWLGVRVIKKKR